MIFASTWLCTLTIYMSYNNSSLGYKKRLLKMTHLQHYLDKDMLWDTLKLQRKNQPFCREWSELFFSRREHFCSISIAETISYAFKYIISFPLYDTCKKHFFIWRMYCFGKIYFCGSNCHCMLHLDNICIYIYIVISLHDVSCKVFCYFLHFTAVSFASNITSDWSLDDTKTVLYSIIRRDF